MLRRLRAANNRAACTAQAMNLREITKKVGRDIGLNLPAVQLFTKQLLLSLYHFRECGVLHADIKPDNILINDRHNAVKACFQIPTSV